MEFSGIRKWISGVRKEVVGQNKTGYRPLGITRLARRMSKVPSPVLPPFLYEFKNPGDRLEEIPKPASHLNVMDHKATAAFVSRLHWDLLDKRSDQTLLYSLVEEHKANRYNAKENEFEGPLLVAVPNGGLYFALLIQYLELNEGKCKPPSEKRLRPLKDHIVSLVVPPGQADEVVNWNNLDYKVGGKVRYLAIPGPLYLKNLVPGTKVYNKCVNPNQWILPTPSGYLRPLWDALGLDKRCQTSEILSRVKFSRPDALRSDLCPHIALVVSNKNSVSPNRRSPEIDKTKNKKKQRRDRSLSPVRSTRRRQANKDAAKKDKKQQKDKQHKSKPRTPQTLGEFTGQEFGRKKIKRLERELDEVCQQNRCNQDHIEELRQRIELLKQAYNL